MTTIIPLSEGSTMISQAKRELNDKDEQYTHSGPSAGCEQQPSIGWHEGSTRSITQRFPHTDASQLAVEARNAATGSQIEEAVRARCCTQNCEAYFCVCGDEHKKNQSAE